MAVDQQRGARFEARRHGEDILVVDTDQDEAVPIGTASIGPGLELAKESFPELEDGLDLIGSDDGLSGGDGRGGQQNVFEVVRAGRKDGSATVDFGELEQIQDREMLDGKDFVHAFEAKAALAVEEIGDVGLLESGLLGEAKTGEFPTLDALQKDFTEVLLQGLELHWGEYSIPGLGLRNAEWRISDFEFVYREGFALRLRVRIGGQVRAGSPSLRIGGRFVHGCPRFASGDSPRGCPYVGTFCETFFYSVNPREGRRELVG